MFAYDIERGQLAQTKLMSVVADFFKAQLAAQCLKIGIVGFCQGFSQIQL